LWISAVKFDGRLNRKGSKFITVAGIAIVNEEIAGKICYNLRLTKASSGRNSHFQTAADSAGEDRRQAVA
jgi:hypothetical protein